MTRKGFGMTTEAPALARLPREVKIQQRRDELADAAIATLGQRGYAHTSLREIAKHSALSHGVVHYYFRDKVELITYCVTRYKTKCSGRYDEVVASASTAQELRAGFAQELRRTMVEDAAMHRLWYDMRAQSMFEPPLRQAVRAIDERLEAMIWAVVTRYAELLDVTPRCDSQLAYASFDGLFESCLVRRHAGDGDAADTLEAQAGVLLDLLVPRV